MTNFQKIVIVGIVGVLVGIYGTLFFTNRTIGTGAVSNAGYTGKFDAIQTTGVDTFTGEYTANTLAGTTTIEKSYDGFIAWDDFTMTATGTARAVYTNSTSGPMICGAANGTIYAKAGSLFSPSLVFSLGTSTSATGYATNILSSTTVATTTTTLLGLGTSRFVLDSGESIVGAISDITNTTASSTYYSRWTVEFSIPCRLLGA